MQKRYFNGKTYNHFIAKFLEEKIREDLNKAKLLVAYVKQNFKEIEIHNKILFGGFEKKVLYKAKKIITKYQEPRIEIW